MLGELGGVAGQGREGRRSICAARTMTTTALLRCCNAREALGGEVQKKEDISIMNVNEV